MGLTSIYYILKKVKDGKSTDDQRHLNAKKTKRTAAIVAAVAANVAEDRRVSCKDLASAHGLSIGTVFNILRDDLGLVKKSARWVPKLLSDEQKQEHVRTCQEFVAVVQGRSLSMLDDIVTMDETMVSFHTAETKKTIQTVDREGQTRPHQGKSASEPNKADGHGVL